MKLKKTFFSLLTVITIGTVATTLITSCSGVSQDIINNMVSTGDNSKLADNVGDSSFDLQSEINTALTDKGATDAFKKTVVNKILKGWFDSIKGNTIVDNDKKQWKNDISDEWDNQIQTAKNSHLSDWKYYFQNETLNPVGGTKAKWEQEQWYSKIRDYFTTEIVKNNYLSIPTTSDSLNKDFYKSNANYKDLVDFNHPTLTSLSNTDIPTLLGGSTITKGGEDILNPDWWPTINFYATANGNYVSGTTDQDKSYALIQQMAFDEYTKNVAPLSTGYVLWNYSLPLGKTDLTDIYNKNKVNASGTSTTSGVSDDPATLSTPSYAFPYFGSADPESSTFGSLELFRSFTKAFDTTEKHQFLDNRSDSDGAGALGLIDIDANPKYTAAADQKTLALINQSDGTGSDETPYETYVAPLLNLLYNYQNSSTNQLAMPTHYKNTSDSYFIDGGDNASIMKNFLFRNEANDIPDGQASVFKLNADVFDNITSPAIFDLSKIYNGQSVGRTQDHIEIFDPKTDDEHWYNDGASYIVSAMRLATDNTKPLPYIMIRTTKGVTLEGIDGVDYLSQQEVDQPTSASPDLTWRPGVPYSQERENQIIKFRTVYQNFTKGPYKGVDVITGDSGSVSGPLVDYLKTNLDVIVLDAVDRVMNTTDVQPDSNDSGSSSYFDDNLLGLKSTLGSTTGNDVWNQNLNKLIQSFQVLNAYTTVTTNIDANNKKLFAFANTYSTNALVSVDKGGVKIYKNGLANGLPLIITNANNYVSTAENRSLAKIHYPVVTTSADNMAKQTGIEDSLTDHWHNDAAYSLLIGQILNNYTDWNNSLSKNEQAIQDNKGNKKAYEYNFSENILTYNDYVNALLWAFGGSNSFTNSVKTAALKQYIGNYSYGDYEAAITSMYTVGKLISSDTPITSYFNATPGGNNSLTFEDYKDNLSYQWQLSLNSNLGSTPIICNDKTITNGYTDKAIDWETYLATIKYLTANNYAKFISWLQGKIGSDSDFQNTAYIVWAAKDNIVLNQDFDTNTSSVSDIYGWKNDYNGLFNNLYQNTNLTDAQVPGSYTSFSKYWQFAPMPQVSSPDLNAMGFLGLQTKNSNSMDQVSADAKAALFDKFSLSSKADHTGSLYQFGSRENLHSQIEKDLRIPTVAKINQYVDFIQAQTGLFDITKNKIDQETNNADKVRDLLDAVNDSGTLPDECFIGYNKSNSTDYTLELRDPTSKDYVIPDSSGSKIGARIRVMQLNRYDVNGDDVITHLNQILGSEMVKYLIAQAALETSNQTATITDVIKTVLKDGKLAVYDRRFNDQLGSQWVQNWKSKN